MTKLHRNGVGVSKRSAAAWRGAASSPRGVLDAQLCFALYATCRATMATYRAPLAELGLTYPRYLVMLALWEQDDVPISALGERLFLDFGTLSPLLKKLELDQLITRARDTSDERMVRVALTQRGRSLRAEVQQMQSKLASRLALVPSTVAKIRKQLWVLLQDLMKAESGIQEAYLFDNCHRNRRTREPRLIGGRHSRRSSETSKGGLRSWQGWRNKP